MMKKLISCFVCCVIVFTAFPAAHADSVTTSAEAFILYCADNGEVILSQNADSELPMASTTKIMTALITLEYAAKENKTVEFFEEMSAEGSSMYLKPDEKVTLKDLAVGMMMQSGNDAANAAAISIAGSTDRFAEIMNSKAEELGMEHTHFVTPSGLDDDGHYSCARDLAMLMTYALKNKSFAEITSQKSMDVDFVEPDGKSVTYANHNKLLSLYDGCIGGKTGYTEKSGRCLVSAAKRDGVTLIAVTLNDPDDWDDHIGLYTYGFNALVAVKPPENNGYNIDIVGGKKDNISLTCGEYQPVVVPRDKAKDVAVRIILPAFCYAPINKGDRVGEIDYLLDGKEIAAIPLEADDAVEFLE